MWTSWTSTTWVCIGTPRLTEVAVLRWVNGDFDYSGNVDATDLNALGVNWQHGVHRNEAVIPEPKSWLLLLGALLIGAASRGQLTRNRSPSHRHPNGSARRSIGLWANPPGRVHH